jgi:hypothetical protein
MHYFRLAIAKNKALFLVASVIFSGSAHVQPSLSYIVSLLENL